MARRVQRAPRSIRRVRRAALLLIAAAVAVVRAAAATYPPPERALSEAERRIVGRAAADQEPAWRQKSRKSFPGDLWSQDDDFHNAEWHWVMDEARRLRTSPADVLRAIDEDLRARPAQPPRKATAAPSKPRPFYD